MKEPYWKLALNWGAVVTFFALPLVVLVLHLYALTHPGWISRPLSGKQEYDFGYVKDLQRDVTFLVFGLAGLRTWEQVRNGKSKEGKRPNEDC